ncbi:MULTISPECIES: hypothetical protein [unclassified Alcanivorax]|uniref:hypothetical protein n=1 Tax=unclassified Alcanivorax TaxID=2638842 RepID=UPI0004B47129|nr:MULTISPECIES: hypothetical protein [unclassified Alcanivorax]
MSTGLYEAIVNINDWHVPECRSFFIPSDFCYPGMWTVVAAFMDRNKVHPSIVNYGNDGLAGYSKALGLSKALGYKDDYSYERKNEGSKYSSLVRLDHDGCAEGATSLINGWFRNQINSESQGVIELCKVIGELHDNVSCHCMGAGFSAGQIYSNGKVYFSITDSGIGLLESMKLSGKYSGLASSHREALEWCLEEGNSSKMVDDEWAQSLPADALHNPYPDDVETKKTQNNHQGLGLYFFSQLAEAYNGTLYVASGDAFIVIGPNGEREFRVIPHWQGLAISCCFERDKILSNKESGGSEQLNAIIDRLTG